MGMKNYEIVFAWGGENRVIECEKITWLTGWVTFTSKGYLHAAYPARVIDQVFEIEGQDRP